MKKTIQMLMVALLIIPVAVIFAACGNSDNTTATPNYEAVAKKHTLNTYMYIKTDASSTGSFESTSKDFNGIIADYLDELDIYYGDVVKDLDAEEYLLDRDETALSNVFDEFNADFNFELVPGEDKFAGKMNVYLNSTSETPILADLPFTISDTNGDMTITGDPAYENENIKYKYNNGEITVEVNAAEIIRDLIRQYNDDEYALSTVSNTKIGQVPPLWVQFELS